MSEYYMGELRIMSFNFAPKNWAMCNGQLLSIAQNQALFSLLGTTYGGDGVMTFALPDLRTRTPLHTSSTMPQGMVTGEYSHTLTTSEMPQHTHFMNANSTKAANTNAAAPTAGAMILGQATGAASSGSPPPFTPYSANMSSPTAMSPQALAPQGGSQPHENRQPFTVLTVCIALTGIYPSRN